MAVNVDETENKYDVTQPTGLPDLGHLPNVAATAGPEEQRLEADYYDTGDLRLLRAGLTLRRRAGGHDEGWHLKLPAGADRRHEIRPPVSRAGQPAGADTMGDQTTAMSWREFEVELAEHGRLELLDRVERRLLAVGARRATSG